jgi:general secretion pathway protein I
VTARRAGRGFTLLEVMVALGILAGALLAVSEIVSGALRNHVRARDLEVATLLARGRMAALEDHYEAKGFPATDESDEGPFEEEGHPEIRWRVEVTAPAGELDGEAMVRALTGSDLKDLLPPPDQAPQLAAFQAQLTVAFQALAARLGENVKKGLREVRLTVRWPAGTREESFQVTTHMLVLAPGEAAPR